MFEGRKLLIASMHEKERVLGPLLEKEFKVHVLLDSSLNTDKFGTFSGEIERTKSVFETLRLKCNEAHKLSSIDLVIASEGSFGPHPTFYFVPANEELIMLRDYRYDLEIVAHFISTETNFSSIILENESELHEFAEKVNFPSHGLIMRSNSENPVEFIKGINTWEKLAEAFQYFSSQSKEVYVETDMRAHMNPTRMKQIELCGLELIKKMKSCCPACHSPGYDVVNVTPGLPCENCSFPTKSILSLTYECKKCSYTEKKFFPKGKQVEEATYCDICNP